MDDDDMLLSNIEQMVTLLLSRYGQHTGVQSMYNEGGDLIDTLVDFSGTFCPTQFVRRFLEEEPNEIEMYDCDCIFVKRLSTTGRGMPDFYKDFGWDPHYRPYVYRRDHNIERDWGKEDITI